MAKTIQHSSGDPNAGCRRAQLALAPPKSGTTPSIRALASVLMLSTMLSTALPIASASAAPAIRTSDTNRMPACVSTERLTAFLLDRNPTLDPRFRDIARWYKTYGEAWNVRWDYAFFQMILETNALKFRKPDGRRGDVHEKQNNFAGIGATGGGVPGDRFADIKTGVHAQIQHLVAYSGEMLAAPIAPRTQLVQDSIVAQSRRLRRTVTFGDLARRWAADRAYARSIDGVAEQFRTAHCNGVVADATPRAPQPQPATRRAFNGFPPPSRLGGPTPPKGEPNKLAGPDTLPWSPPDSTVAQSAAAEAAPAPTGTPRKVPPVRTIWSRDGVIPPAQTSAAAKPLPNTQAAEPVAADKPVQQPAVDATPAEATTHLPQFRIQPTQLPPPQRLGGPVDVLPAGTAAPAARVQFKDIVRLPFAPDAAPTLATPPPVSEQTHSPCRVLTASYGGRKTLLVRALAGAETQYTALTVLDGFEQTMFDTYARAAAPGAELVGSYDDKDQALADARANCPNG